MFLRVRRSGGSAAAQCGEALPHRRRAEDKEAQPRRWKSKSTFSVSHRLPALCCGRAAKLLTAHRPLLTVALLALTPSLMVGLLPRVFSQDEAPSPQAQPSPTPAPSPSRSPAPPPNLHQW